MTLELPVSTTFKELAGIVKEQQNLHPLTTVEFYLEKATEPLVLESTLLLNNISNDANLTVKTRYIGA